MNRFVARVAFALLAVLMACACDAPWAGPSLPNASHSLSFTVERDQGATANGVGILAATSVADLRRKLLASPLTNKVAEPCGTGMELDPCWSGVVDDSARVYLALTTISLCYRALKEAAALNDHRVYFIYWIGSPQKTCNLALRVPNWRLISIPRSELAGSGSYAIELQVQEDGNLQAYDTQLDLP